MTTTPAADPPTPRTDPPPSRTLGRVGTFVDTTIDSLQRQLFSPRAHDRAHAVAALARLRRGAGKPPGAVLDALEFTVSETFWFGDEHSPADAAVTETYENAAHLAMTLYATHQQSQGRGMHRRGRGLGAGLRLLDTGPTSEPTRQRFRRLGTADSFAELTHHLRSAVQLLRAEGAPLDYGRLGDELVAWQGEQRSKVQLGWARGFYRSARAGSSAPSAAPDA